MKHVLTIFFFSFSDSEVQFLVPSKQVDLNTKNCYLSDGTAVPCVDIEVTLEYSGVGVPDQIGNLSKGPSINDVGPFSNFMTSLAKENCWFYLLKSQLRERLGGS